MLISDGYRALNEQLHIDRPLWGSGAEDSQWIIPWIKGFNSALDYGCGKGRLTIGCPDFRRYDPCIPAFSAEPYPADLVVSNKVLEHVEPEFVDAVLDHIKSLANQRVVIKVSTFETQIRLSDGTSPHRTVKDDSWWLEKLMARWSLHYAETMKRGLRFVGEARNGNIVD